VLVGRTEVKLTLPFNHQGHHMVSGVLNFVFDLESLNFDRDLDSTYDYLVII